MKVAPDAEGYEEIKKQGAEAPHGHKLLSCLPP